MGCDVESGFCVCKDGFFNADDDAMNGCESDKPNDEEEGDNDGEVDGEDEEDQPDKPTEEECEEICMEVCGDMDDDKCDPKEEDCKPDEDEDEDDKPDDDKCDPEEEDCKPDEDEEEDDKPDDNDKPDEEEEEEKPFDSSICPDEPHPVSWLSGKYARELYTSANAKFYQVNVPVKMIKTTDPTASDYSGFLLFSQKYCGSKFIDAVNSGDVMVDFYEAGDLITVGDSFKRDDKGKQSAAIQFMVNKGEGDTVKEGKADQFWMSINGFGDVEFKTDMAACLAKMNIGVADGEFKGELGCIAISKTIW